VRREMSLSKLRSLHREAILCATVEGFASNLGE